MSIFRALKRQDRERLAERLERQERRLSLLESKMSAVTELFGVAFVDIDEMWIGRAAFIKKDETKKDA